MKVWGSDVWTNAFTIIIYDILLRTLMQNNKNQTDKYSRVQAVDNVRDKL